MKPKLRFPGYEEEWEEKKLGEVLKVNSGKDYKHLNSGTIPVYGTGGIITYVDQYLSSKDGIGIGRKGTIDKPIYLKAPYWTVDTLFYCLTNFSNEFVFNICRRINWKKYDESTGVPSLSKQNIEKIKICIPSLLEQEKIGEFFSLLDQRIEKQEEKIELMKDRKKGWMQKVFHQEIRFKDENGNDYPDWEENKLEKVAKYRRGSFPQPYTNKDYYDEEKGMPFIQVVDVQENMKLNKDTKQHISRKAEDKSVFIPKNSVIVTIQGSIGRVAITQYDAYMDRTLLVFQKFLESINKQYFAYEIERIFNIEKQKAPGGTIKTITKAALSNFIVNIPSLPEQEKIANFLSTQDKLIEKEEEKLNLLKEQKKGLLQQMFV